MVSIYLSISEIKINKKWQFQKIRFLTLSDKRMVQHTRLKTASHGLVSPIFDIMLVQVSKNASDLNLSPNKFLTWALAIIKDAADVKPATTGTETNSTKKPAKIIKINNNSQKN